MSGRRRRGAKAKGAGAGAGAGAVGKRREILHGSDGADGQWRETLHESEGAGGQWRETLHGSDGADGQWRETIHESEGADGQWREILHESDMPPGSAHYGDAPEDGDTPTPMAGSGPVPPWWAAGGGFNPPMRRPFMAIPQKKRISRRAVAGGAALAVFALVLLGVGSRFLPGGGILGFFQGQGDGGRGDLSIEATDALALNGQGGPAAADASSPARNGADRGNGVVVGAQATESASTSPSLWEEPTSVFEDHAGAAATADAPEPAVTWPVGATTSDEASVTQNTQPAAAATATERTTAGAREEDLPSTARTQAPQPTAAPNRQQEADSKAGDMQPGGLANGEAGDGQGDGALPSDARGADAQGDEAQENDTQGADTPGADAPGDEALDPAGQAEYEPAALGGGGGGGGSRDIDGGGEATDDEVPLGATPAQGGSPAAEPGTEPGQGAPTERPSAAYADNFVMPAPGVRPIAAVIDNAGTRVLPQASLEKAQVVYELLVEGGISSFIAVFWPSPSLEVPIIGPVQRVGSYFLDYAAEHDALLLHIGQSRYAERDFSVVPVERVPRGIYNKITGDPRNYQDSFTTSDLLAAYMRDRGVRDSTDAEPVYKYSGVPVELAGHAPATSVRVNYSSRYWAEYAFDAESGLYLRSRNGAPHMARLSLSDEATDVRIAAKNVLALFVDNHTMNKEGYQSMDNVGAGTGYYFTNGRAAAITWTKASREAPTRCAYADTGEPLLLNPGKTFVQITPTESYGKNGVIFN